jgi:hypothetical protein
VLEVGHVSLEGIALAVYLIPVDSSNLRAVGYHTESQTLEIEFQNGHLYRYRSVPPFVHRALMASTSKGAYFSDVIRDKYPYEQLR